MLDGTKKINMMMMITSYFSVIRSNEFVSDTKNNLSVTGYSPKKKKVKY